MQEPIQRIVLSFFQLKSIGPKLVPFFKTATIYFVLFSDETRPESPVRCIVKCLPVISLMFFVLMHGMSFSEYYSYSRKVLAGLVFSCVGDAFMVWSTAGYFIPGVAAFAIAQVHCSVCVLYRHKPTLCRKFGHTKMFSLLLMWFEWQILQRRLDRLFWSSYSNYDIFCSFENYSDLTVVVYVY